MARGGRGGKSAARMRYLKAAEELGISLGTAAETSLDDAPQQEHEAGTKKEDAEDFEAQMKRELEELDSEAGRPTKRRRGEEPAGSNESEGAVDASSSTSNAKGGFRSKKTDCDCLAFLTVPRPANPTQLLAHIVSAVRSGRREFSARHIQRCTPVIDLIPATPTELGFLAKRVLTPVFGPERTMSDISAELGIKFRIETFIRNHTAPLSRASIISTIGDVVDSLSVPPSVQESERAPSPPAYPPPPPPKWKHKVDIEHSELVILATVFKNVVGISVVNAKDYDGDGRKWNLMAVAEAQEKAATAAPREPEQNPAT